jgi:hypothetical protein
VNSATLQNLTAMAFAGDDPSGPERWKLQVSLGSERSHVQEQGYHLYLKIREILEYKCKENAYGRDVCDQSEYSWGPVNYNSINNCGVFKRGFCRDDSRHVLQVYSSNFPSASPGMREMFIEHVASVFGATVDEVSCCTRT